MAQAARYIRQRDGVFYFVRAVPDAIRAVPAVHQKLFAGQRLFRVSLRTKEQSVALTRAAEIGAEFDRRVDEAEAKQLVRVRNPRGTKPLTQDELNAVYDRTRAATINPWATRKLNADARPEVAEALEHDWNQFEQNAEDYKRLLTDPGAVSDDPKQVSPLQQARDAIETEGYAVDEGTPEFGKLVGTFRAARLDAYAAVAAIMEGTARPVIANPPKAHRACPTIREAVEAHVEQQKPAARTVREIESTLERFVKIVGNKRLNEISRNDFRKYLAAVGSETVGGKTPGSIVRPVAQQTVEKRVAFLRAAINLAIERGRYEGDNPAARHDISKYVTRADPRVTPNKRPFSVGELNQLMKHPWFAGCRKASDIYAPGSYMLADMHFWGPMVAMLSGCRASELGGMKLNEVLIDDPHPHFVIRDNEYRRTKGGYSRKVPILDALFDLGFREYVERVRKAGEDRLFPDWLPHRKTGDDAQWSNAAMLRAFNRTVIPAVFGDSLLDGARREITFHSLRGAFKTMLEQHGVTHNAINEVIGHAKDELDRRYVGTVPIEVTYPAVRGAQYAGLNLPQARTA